MEWIKRHPIENVLLDAALLVVAFALPSANLLLSENLTAAFWCAAPVQVLALFCAFYGRESHNPGRNLPEWLSLAYILNTILAVGSFFWLYLVAFAVEKQAGGFPYWGFRFAFFIALFGGLLVFGFSLGRSDGDALSLKARYLFVLIVFLFLCFTESLLEVSLAISTPDSLLVFSVTTISYLPVRLALAFQPPFSCWDLTSAIVCFGVYLYSVL